MPSLPIYRPLLRTPGVGKTLSAERYSRWDQIQGAKSRDLPDDQLQELVRADALLYTTPVVNSPREIERDIPKLRDLLRDFRLEPIRREETRKLKQIQKRDVKHRDSFFSDYNWFSEKLPRALDQHSDRSAAGTLTSSAPLVTRPDSFWWMKQIA